MTSWEGVTARKGKFGTVEFRLGRYVLGHAAAGRAGRRAHDHPAHARRLRARAGQARSRGGSNGLTRRVTRLFRPYRGRLTTVLGLIVVISRPRRRLAVPAARRPRRRDPAGRRPAAGPAGRGDDRDRDRDRHPRRAPDLALKRRRPARDARPARAGLPPPAAALARLLHAHAHRRDPVADRQRHRRRADGRDEHRHLDRLQRDDGGRRPSWRCSCSTGGSRSSRSR